MKGSVIALDHVAGREAAALMQDGKLEDLLIASDAPAPGTVYLGKVERAVKGQGGLFLATPDGSAFLRDAKGLKEGALVPVQVTGYAEPGKAIPVTSKVLFKSRYAIVTPSAPGLNVSRSIRDEEARVNLKSLLESLAEDTDMGVILRTAAETAEEDEVADDIVATLQDAAQTLAEALGQPKLLRRGPTPHQAAWINWSDPAQIETHTGSFEQTGVLDAIPALFSPHEPLEGGSMYIEPTRALVAVDVNAGPSGGVMAGLKTNFAAAKALPRALRLRGLGGQITLDLAPLPKKDRRGFESTLRAAFKRDGIETALVGWTPLGHFELQRKRERLPLAALGLREEELK